ncbi:glycogen synthase [Alkalicoccus urumqiensis]|uniref:Glycogen synthase n=1 Tax=Alkalicoccus urumqiensis TaxID=1548213 RepID=A0A2P6MGH2_ALKUR|nr:glycogen synthase [Alkalicoccus urumqiensis]PRO65388.1 starch synthase [Alkalicoccus urumqiensis]
MTHIVFAASECTPFVKTGGLADVIGSLPQALREQTGHEISVILPLYDQMDEAYRSQLIPAGTLNVPVGWRSQGAALHKLVRDGITYYFVENEFYFGRHGAYGYFDDGERFVFFSRAVVEIIQGMEERPDILHAHDWQTGMAVAFANIMMPDLKSVFTIHNIQYQGWMTHEAFYDLMNVGPEHFPGMEWHGMINCMKAAIFHADKITTVSPSYAEEIKQPYYGEGLDPLLNERSIDLMGIVNGIDTADYDPMKDPNLYVPYRTSRAKKKENKRWLQRELCLPEDGDIPMYAAISRFVEQKGFHLLERILDEFLQENVQVVILGTGDYAFEQSFAHFAGKYPDKMVTLLKFSEATARQIYAAADFFLMPSKFEPCGLSQLISLQYKTIPIVRETGGLRDTVLPYDEITGEGNGFSFANYNAHELLYTMRYSLLIYSRPELLKPLLQNVNKSRFSWKDSAKLYDGMYKELLTL